MSTKVTQGILNQLAEATRESQRKTALGNARLNAMIAELNQPTKPFVLQRRSEPSPGIGYSDRTGMEDSPVPLPERPDDNFNPVETFQEWAGKGINAVAGLAGATAHNINVLTGEEPASAAQNPFERI